MNQFVDNECKCDGSEDCGYCNSGTAPKSKSKKKKGDNAKKAKTTKKTKKKKDEFPAPPKNDPPLDEPAPQAIIDLMSEAKTAIYDLILDDAYFRFQSTPAFVEYNPTFKKKEAAELGEQKVKEREIQFWFDAIPKKGKWDEFKKPSKKGRFNAGTGYKLFLKHAEKEKNAEHIQFYTACRELETYEDRNDYTYLVRFDEIYEEFLSLSAPKEINIIGKLMKRLRLAHREYYMSEVAPPFEIPKVMRSAERAATRFVSNLRSARRGLKKAEKAGNAEKADEYADKIAEYEEREADMTEFLDSCETLKESIGNGGIYMIKFHQIYMDYCGDEESQLFDGEVDDALKEVHDQFFDAVV